MEERRAAPSNMAAGERLRDEVRLVARVELVAEVFDVSLYGPWSDAELLRALLRRKTARDALKDVALAI